MALRASIAAASDMVFDADMENFYLTSSAGKGINVMIHEPFSNPRVNGDAIAIQPGFEVRIGLEKHVIKDLPKPYSEVDCIREDLEEYQFQTKSSQTNFSIYTFENCMLDCMMYYFIDECDCRLDDFNINACTLEHYYTCIRQRQNNHYTHCTCKSPCQRTKYGYKISMLEFPTPHYAEEIAEVNIEEVKRNRIALRIYYPSLHYTVTEQVEAFTLDELMSNLGGQLGLFLGVSIITLIELLEAMLLVMMTSGKKMFNHKHQAKTKIQ